MKKDNFNKIEQQNVGDSNKNIAGNYYENNYWYHNDKNWLLSMPMSKQDELTENNELLFKKRFGFDAPYEQRVQVISVKKEFDLTDREIRLLKQSGFMTLGKGKSLVISIDFSSIFIGILQIIMFFLLLITMVIFLQNDVPHNHHLLGIIFFTIASVILLYIGNRVAFEPLKIIKQRGISAYQKTAGL